MFENLPKYIYLRPNNCMVIKMRKNNCMIIMLMAPITKKVILCIRTLGLAQSLVRD